MFCWFVCLSFCIAFVGFGAWQSEIVLENCCLVAPVHNDFGSRFRIWSALGFAHILFAFNDVNLSLIKGMFSLIVGACSCATICDA